MSRPEISNIQPFANVGQHLRSRASRDGHRAVLAVDGWPIERFALLAGCLDAPLIGDDGPVDRADRVTGLLGSEFDVLCHDMHRGCDAGLLAALAGTLRAGGLLVVRLPSTRTSGTEGQQRERHGSIVTSKRFEQRLRRLLLMTADAHPGKVMVAGPNLLDPANPALLTSESPAATPGTTGNASAAIANSIAIARAEQDRLLARAYSHLSSHRHCCLTIRGRRGRGKSALLGRLAARLQQQGALVVATAARRSAMQSASRQGAALRPVAPEVALQASGDVLIVEEAASLPLSVLQQYLHHWRKLVLCTTLEGYEQSGRALAIRLQGLLRESGHACLSIEPRHPWRWRDGDPLEAWIDRLLLLPAESDDARSAAELPSASTPNALTTGRPDHAPPYARAVPAAPLLSPDAPRVRCIDRDALVQDETRLNALFSLLRDSHYQTRSTDLRHLLDAPAWQIWTLEANGLQAAMILCREGNIAAHLQAPILRRERRLPDQLLPQQLAQFIDEPFPLSCCMLRVLRIAVPVPLRRRGLGSMLLQQVMQALSTQMPDIHAIGASLAGDDANTAFWQANGFTRFHSGFRLNPRTGKRAVAYLHTTDARLTRMLSIAHRLDRDNRRHASRLYGDSADTSPAVTGSPEPDTADLDTRLLTLFARGQRQLADTAAAVVRLSARHDYGQLLRMPGESRRQHERRLRGWVGERLQ